MPDNITATDSMVSYEGEIPWHEKGKVLQGTTRDADQVMRDSGLTWTADKRGIYLQMAEQPIPNYQAIVRSDNGFVLNIASKQFEPVQTYDLFHALDPITSAGFADWVTAGSLNGGRTVWGQVKFNWQAEVVPGDIIKSHLVVSNSHDGSQASRFTLTMVRVVCENTLNASFHEGKTFLRAVHRAYAIQAMFKNAAEFFDGVVREAQRNLLQYQLLARHKMDIKQRREMIEQLLPMPTNEDGIETPQLKASRRRNEEAWDEIERLSTRGTGYDIEGVMGTAWGALNGVTEYVDHFRYEGKSREMRDGQVMFGKGAEIKDRALEYLLEFVKAA